MVIYVKEERRKPGCGAIFLHTFLTLITGGLWLIVLLVKHLLT